MAKATQAAKKRKAALDREEANKAKEYYDSVKARADKAGKNVSSYEKIRLLYIDKVQSATSDDARSKAQEQVKKYEAMIIEQKLVQEESAKEASRLKEAYENAQSLARIAEEMASAKEATDQVIDNLVASSEDVSAQIEKRNA